MDVTTLRAPGRFVPEFQGNKADPEPMVLHIKPMVQEFQLQAMEVHAAITERTPGPDAAPSLVAAAARESWSQNLEFTRRVLTAHVVGFENLTNGGEEMELPEVIELLIDLPGLGGEVFSEIVSSGTLTEADAKN